MDDTPNRANPPGANDRKSWAPTAGFVAGAIMLASGAGIFVIGVPTALRRLNEGLSSPGIGDPRALAGGISHGVTISVTGGGLVLAGLIVLVVSIIAVRREEEK